MAKSIDALLDLSIDKIGSFPGINSIYIFDLAEKKIRYKILDKLHDKDKIYRVLKKVVPLFKEEDFDMLVVDLGERIFIYRLPDGMILMVSSRKDIQLGKLFAIAKSIIQESKT